LEDKYRSVNSFIKSVIDVSINEINNKTDINISYELHKTGKRFTDITLKFSQKKNLNKQLPKSEAIDTNVSGQSMIVSIQLQSYGIPKNKALEYVKTYGGDIYKLGIEKLLGEIQKGREIKNVSGYLVSCIENEGNRLTSTKVKKRIDKAEELEAIHQAQKLERFSEFNNYIENNREQIMMLFLRHRATEKLIDEIEIDMHRCLKEVTATYDDLATLPYYLKFKFNDEFLRYDDIKSVVEELQVSSKEERIAKLKADLEAKKVELDEVSGKAKELVEKEIMMLKGAIADLV
jgi:hypothetical protein